MAKTASLVLVAVLLINSCSAENVYCVTPTAISCSFCPRNSTHCATLSEYGREAKSYFTSNTTMVFLPGQHTLDLNITVTNVARLTMRRNFSANDVAMIVCNGSVGLSFSSMVEFKINFLHFRSCSKKYDMPPASNYALLLQSTQYAELVNCSFYDNIGTAIVVDNTSNISVWNSEFAHNHCQPKSCIGGGGIIVLNSNLTFIGNITFLENYATFYGPMSGGGAIYTSNNSILSFNGTNNFISNSADYGGRGGAIYATNNAVLIFSGTSNFISNSADYGSGGGGAIFASNSSRVSFTGTSNFINNTADYYAGDNSDGGGAIYTSGNTVLSFRGNNNFIGNSASYGSGNGGGAICASKNAVLRFNGTNNFTSNSAYYSDDGGGAIYASTHAFLSFSGTNIFFNNSADHGGSGGAIYTSDSIELGFNGTNSFINNSAEYGDGGGGGGAIYASDKIVLSFSGTSSFIDNSANYGSVGGGAIYTSDLVVFSFIGTSIFISNSAQLCTGGGGGAMYTSDNIVLRFYGTNNFISNSADYGGGYGGAIFATNNATLSFNGSSHFASNSATSRDTGGGAIFATENTVLSFLGVINFISNIAGNDGGGALLTSGNTVVSFNGSNNFISNSVDNGVGQGGAISTSGNAILSFSGTNNFISNFAGACGAIYTYYSVLSFNGTNNFINNSAGFTFGSEGGAICTSETVFNFSGINNFINNSAGTQAGSGGAIRASKNAILCFNGTNNFISNSADYGSKDGGGNGGAIFASYSTALKFNGTTTFFNNSAADRGGAIFIDTNSTLAFNRNITFVNNGGQTNKLNRETLYGGGVCIGLQSTFSILPNTTVYWKKNCARYGGAIYVIDAIPLSYCAPLTPYVPKEECFYQVPGQNLSNIDVQLVFKDNSADAAGSMLYGGTIDNCKLTGLESYNSGKVFNKLVHIDDSNDYSTTSGISSQPRRICRCINKLPDRSEWDYVTVHPGETFQASVVAAGQRDGTVPDNIISVTQGELLPSQYLQQAGNTCTKLNYTVFSLSQQVVILLHAESNPCSVASDTNAHAFRIKVNLNQTCPHGFNISESAKACVCEPRLAEYTGTHQCNITNGEGKIERMSSQKFWIGYSDQSQELIIHPYCPFDYCVNNTVTFPLSDTDIQCAHNRSGLLCGACENNYSLVLGSHHCKQCTNSHLVLLIPFALMGVALVFFLLVCKLTVATGTLSGLVFYANIVGVNRTIFLPVESTHPFTVFIAWINLDFGIETCLYNGLDAYSKTWLQFVFPVYIWVIVGLIILVSHYSRMFANRLGSNPVSVLATLILLSYTKILRTFIAAIHITYLEYPTYNRSVWLYDGNIDYLSGKHIPLFLVAVLVFLFLFLPYTLLLLFGQWLQAISHLRLFSWVNKLKPFLDAYHAPYKAKHRYWPGLLLTVRFFLLLVFALNLQQDPSINLLAILVGTGLLHLWAWVSGGVYRSWCLDALEGSFVLNLIILVGTTMYTNQVRHSEGSQVAVGYTSVSIALATFIGILVLQLSNVTGVARYLKRKCTALKRCVIPIRDGEIETDSDTDSLPDRLINAGEYEPISQTAAVPTGGNNDERNVRELIPAYTYSSVN